MELRKLNMSWLDEISSDEIANILVIDSDILMRLYNKSLSREDAIELVSTGIAFNVHICITIFTYFEFFKGVTENCEYENRLRFLYTSTDGVLNYGKIGFDEEVNPEFWIENKEFNLCEFKRFYLELKDKIYEFTKEYLISLIDGICAISLLVKSCLGKIDRKCFATFAICSNQEDALKSKVSLIENILDENYKKDFFIKDSSKKIIDAIINVSLALFNVLNEDVRLFVPTTDKEISEFLSSKNEECATIRNSKNLNCKSVSTFCESYLKYLNRNHETNIVFVGFTKLTIDYFCGRPISSNDLIDLFNINSIEVNISRTETFYGTKERYWNNEFINKYAKKENKIWKCTILEFE